MVRYSIDTSAILEGWVRHYPPDVFPVIWQKIEELIASGELKANEEVLYELEKKDDNVFKWAKGLPQLFVPIDTPVQLEVIDILKNYPRLIDTRKNRSSADAFVIGLAKINSCLVVTEEKPTNKLEKPNIPDVCDDLGIRWIDLLGLFREQVWIFDTDTGKYP